MDDKYKKLMVECFKDARQIVFSTNKGSIIAEAIVAIKLFEKRSEGI